MLLAPPDQRCSGRRGADDQISAALRFANKVGQVGQLAQFGSEHITETIITGQWSGGVRYWVHQQMQNFIGDGIDYLHASR
jgi:hypothetical protein